VKAVSGVLPDPMQDFLNIEQIIEDFISIFVGEPIDQGMFS